MEMTPTQSQLDLTFAALSDPTAAGHPCPAGGGRCATVNELVAPFNLSQPAISKHLKVLEAAGLVSRGKDAQRRPVHIEAAPMAEAVGWLEEFRKFWEHSYGRLDGLLAELQKPRTQDRQEELRTRAMMPPLTIALPSDREIEITRTFKAPAELVFDCWTIPP